MTERLTPYELAAAAVMADLTVGVVIIAKLTPFAYLTTVLGAIPFAVLALRHRRHVVVVSFWIAVILTFLLAGFSSATQVLVMALFGGVSGRAAANGWGPLRTSLTAIAVGWTAVASLSVGVLAALPGFRALNLDAVEVQWQGTTRLLERVGLAGAAAWFDPLVRWGIDKWYMALPLAQLAFSVVVVLLVGRIGGPTVRRVDQSIRPDGGEAPHVRREDIDRILSADGFVALTGPNGAGKSTLLRAAAMSGSASLGRANGTTWIGQRPASQVLGARVVDDLVWGLEARPSPVAIGAALRTVGLSGFERRETDSLSGGEQQRLAIAAALLRKPSLVLSDETTAMLDPAGRASVRRALLSVARQGTGVVHATHLDDDIAIADANVNLDLSR